MNAWHDISVQRISPKSFLTVIEIPKGSKKKYELDKESGLLILDRILSTSTHYPENYGFIPKTLAGDNDPLDVLVICEDKLNPLSLIKCRPIGVLKMIDNNEVDEKIIAVPENDPVSKCFVNIDSLPDYQFNRIKHFFEVYKFLENKKTEVDEIYPVEEAYKIIENCLENYRKKFDN